MYMAAMYGGIAFTKGLGIGHAIAHVIGAQYHISHGRAVAMSLLCFVRANEKVCQEQFSDLVWVLNRSNNLGTALIELYHKLDLPVRIRDFNIPEKDLPKIALETSLDAANLASNPSSVSKSQILKTLKEFY